MKPGHELSHLIDAELEAVVLGTILQVGESAYREVQFLTRDDFAIEKHRLIFDAISELAAEVNPTIDAVTERLSEAGKLDAIGGLSGLVDVDQRAIPGMRLAGFARSLRRKAADRRAYRLNEKLGKALAVGFSANSAEVRAIAEELRALEYVLETDVPARTFGQCLEEAGGIDALCSPPANLIPLAWMHTPVRGFQPGQLIVGAGRTSAGKTVLGAQQAAHAAKAGHRTLFISLEMSTLAKCFGGFSRWWPGSAMRTCKKATSTSRSGAR